MRHECGSAVGEIVKDRGWPQTVAALQGVHARHLPAEEGQRGVEGAVEEERGVWMVVDGGVP